MRPALLAGTLAILAIPAVGEARTVSSETVRAEAAAARAASRTILHRGAWPFATLDQVAALGQFWTSNSLYALRDAGGERRWVIRRVFGDMGGNKGLVWADSRTCPAVKAALEAMEALPAVRPEAPGLGVEDWKPSGLDGVVHTFWNQGARTGSGGAAVEITIQGNMDAPVAVWWADATTRLKGCWSEREPA